MTPKNKDGFLDVGQGHTIYWASFGNAEAPPLLLIHGGGGHVFNIEKMTGINFAKHHVILMHQRGVGQSTYTGDVLNANNIAENTRDIERLRQHLELGRLDLFAWSFGAVLMTDYASQYPQHCKTLTAYAPYLASEDDWAIVTRTYAALGKDFLREKGATSYAHYCRDKFNNVAAKADVPAAEKVGAALENEALNGYPPDWLADEAAFARLDLIPTTLIFGNNDPWVANNPNIQRVFPKANIINLKPASHDVHEEAVQKAIAFALTAHDYLISKEPPMTTLTESFNNASVKAGEKFGLELRNLASAGYSWNVKVVSGEAQSLGQQLAEPYDFNKHGIGGGPGEVFTFVANKPGAVVIEATSARAWNPQDVGQKLTFKVNVTP